MTKASNVVVVVGGGGGDVCCTYSDVGRGEIYIWQETIDYHVFRVNILNDTPKIIVYKEVVSLHRVI